MVRMPARPVRRAPQLLEALKFPSAIFSSNSSVRMGAPSYSFLVFVRHIPLFINNTIQYLKYCDGIIKIVSNIFK
jgi:hypothetical protein